MSKQIEVNVESPDSTEKYEGVADQVVAHDASVNNSFVGVVRAERHASVANSIAAAFVAGQNLDIDEGFGNAFVAGANIEMKGSGGLVLVAGANIDIHGGGGAFLNCKQATVENSTIGVLFAPQAALGENVNVVMSTTQAIAMGAAFGFVAGVLGLLFRRRR
jgi:hypothetical protein